MKDDDHITDTAQNRTRYIEVQSQVARRRLRYTFRSMVFSLIKVEILSSNFKFLSVNSLALDSKSFV